MLSAWREYQYRGRGDFGAALRWAWAREQRLALAVRDVFAAADANGGVAAFSPDLTLSPIRRSLGQDPYAGSKARAASYLTSRLGR